MFIGRLGEILDCQGSYEKKVIENYVNKNRLHIDWQIRFDVPGGRKYFVDMYIKESNLYIEIKGYFRKGAKEKWDWFHKEHSNSELWNEQKLKELNII